MFKLTKLGSYLHNTNIWVIFGQNSGFWPPGVQICLVTPHCFTIYFEEIVSRFVLNAIFFYIWYCLKVRNCIIRIFRPFFGPNLGFWPPRGDISGVTPWGGHNFFLCFQPYFRKNLGLGWIFMFKLTKMTKNYQNMVKTWNFKFFSNFGTPQGFEY